jgi:hypothetical protein
MRQGKAFYEFTILPWRVFVHRLQTKIVFTIKEFTQKVIIGAREALLTSNSSLIQVEAEKMEQFFFSTLTYNKGEAPRLLVDSSTLQKMSMS